MADNFYETLEISRASTSNEVRAAYRRLVLVHHPDRTDGRSEKFIAITQAYEVLRDPERRMEYDRLLDLRAQRAAQPTPPRAQDFHPPPEAPRRNTSKPVSVVEDLERLVKFYRKGAFEQAEQAARQVLAKDPRQAMPYAILGDLARSRGDLAEATRFYAFAIQMDPRNSTYVRKHQEVLNRSEGGRLRPAHPGLASTIAFSMILLGCVYVVLSQEPPAFQEMGWISTWTLGLVVMLFLSGVVLGVGLSMGRLVDRFSALSSNSLDQTSPALALALVAIVNFWAAAVLYALVSLKNRTNVVSISRLLGGVALVLGLLSMAASGSQRIDPVQVLIWGGNLIYAGSICGWMVTDSLEG